MRLPDSSLELQHLGQISELGCYHLIQTKHIRQVRARLAFSSPPVRNSEDCSTPWTYGFRWQAEWWGGFARLIHHPDIHLGFEGIPKKLAEVPETGIDGVYDGCLGLTINSILEDGKFGQEDEYIAKAVTALMAHQTDEPIRAALSALRAN
ncbi:hypothetical protein FB451DRAFT_1400311 [Mycena latifolia]|nr:hypothetical protein FB451DRAFT_1400311 [Mycena latifolia]